MSDGPLSKIKGIPKIDVITFNSWEMIFVNGKQWHWHDCLSAGELLCRLGVPESENVPNCDEIEDAVKASCDHRDRWEDHVPSTLPEIRKLITKHKKAELVAKRDELQKQLAALDAEIGSDG